jgi:hypothetical protein
MPAILVESRLDFQVAPEHFGRSHVVNCHGERIETVVDALP